MEKRFYIVRSSNQFKVFVVDSRFRFLRKPFEKETKTIYNSTFKSLFETYKRNCTGVK